MLKPFTAEALLLRLEPTTTAAAAPKSLAILSHRYFWIMDFPSRLIKEVVKDASSYGTKKISAKRLNDVACQIGLASFDTSKVFVFFLFKHFAILICPIDK
ncbi:uncharacterized protein LOC110936027 isoform X2 [Helianthus annuus]|uniref:uncharacterized protein LOC110936027 isoform X2 n=1 Tax=Helianthus annuus TaxID=4232 RepID=UPI000B8F3A6E|nr:uncharacterized protein LOC110936027 isoform X2 [Helianthus annuus]